MLQMIEEPYRKKALILFKENETIFRERKASKAKHQVWRGGYLNHIEEVMNIAIVLYNTLNALRPLPFSLSDALLILFLHDLEKIWIGNNYRQLPLKERFKIIVNTLSKKYGFKLTAEQLNGLKYVEGEGEEFHPTKRIQGPLAAFAHVCDVISARIWYNYPAAQNDPWEGAVRYNNEI